jgi:hypothetical protein
MIYPNNLTLDSDMILDTALDMMQPAHAMAMAVTL